jgi:hypothetical protein
MEKEEIYKLDEAVDACMTQQASSDPLCARGTTCTRIAVRRVQEVGA